MVRYSSAMIVAVVGSLGFSQPAAAQTGHLFVFGGPIAPLFSNQKPSSALTFGGGFEALTRHGVGASLEAGVFGVDNFWVPQLSANAVYEKRSNGSAVSP